MKKERWTAEEENHVRDLYTGSREDASKLKSILGNRSWISIKLRANKLGLKMDLGRYHQESDAENILQLDTTAAYWLGFLLADGHFSKSGRITLTLASKDRNHVKMFADFVSCPNLKDFTSIHGYASTSVTFQNPQVCAILQNRYQISNNKTVHPPNLINYPKHLLSSLFIGFFDGDGRISNRTYGFHGGIKCFSSWLPTFHFWKNELELHGNPKIDNAGYASWNICANDLRWLKDQAMHYELPILHRKWDKVTEATVRSPLSHEQLNYIRNSEKNTNQLSKELGINYTTIKRQRSKT